MGTSHRRVQDLLVDAKIPRWEREQIPVFRTPRGVVWVAGVRAASWATHTAPGPSIRLTVERIAPDDEDARRAV